MCIRTTTISPDISVERIMGQRIRTTAFRSDERGAFMVMGIFMSLFLVGALWSIAGTGQALVFHERMQEAADAAALGAASVDARGMNMLVLLNIAMSAIMSVRVVIVAMLVCAGDPNFVNLRGNLSVDPGSTVTIPAMLNEAQALKNKYDPGITTALNQLQAAGSAIATGAPVVAAESGTKMSYFYDPTGVQSTATVVEGTGAGTGGTLPVGNGGDACGIGAALATPWGTPTPPPKLIDALIAPTFSPGSAEETDVYNMINDVNNGDLCEPGTTSATGFGTLAPAMNATSDYQIFTSVASPGETSNLATALVQFANSRGPAVPMNTPSLTSFSEAEFFFDCAETWDACGEYGMYNFFWRSHFRLFNTAYANAATKPPTDVTTAEQAAEALLTAHLTNDKPANLTPLGTQFGTDIDPVSIGTTGVSLTLH
jgi:hypothetical protein